MPTPSGPLGPFDGLDTIEDLSPIGDVGSLEQAPQDQAGPPMSEVESPAAPAPVEASTAQDEAMPASDSPASPAALPATGVHAQSPAIVWEPALVVLLVGVACVALSRALRRA
jgi:hypothetical protein